MEKEKVFFGKSKTQKFYLPGSKDQWIEHGKLTEGQRRKYEDTTSHRVAYNNTTEVVEMDMSIGSDRKALFDVAVVGYNILVEGDDGTAITKNSFDAGEWSIIQEKMDSNVAQLLLEDIREFNPWLTPNEAKSKKK